MSVTRYRKESASSSCSTSIIKNPEAKIEDVVEFLRSVPEEERYDLQLEWSLALLENHQTVGESVEKLWNYLQSDDAWRANHSVHKEECWDSMKTVVVAVQKERNRQLEAGSTVVMNWGQENVDWLVGVAYNRTYHALTAIRKLSIKQPLFSKAMTLLAHATLSRLETASKGR